MLPPGGGAAGWGAIPSGLSAEGGTLLGWGQGVCKGIPPGGGCMGREPTRLAATQVVQAPACLAQRGIQTTVHIKQFLVDCGTARVGLELMSDADHVAPGLLVRSKRADAARGQDGRTGRSEEHTSELQSRENLVCRLLLEKKKKKIRIVITWKHKRNNGGR